MSLQPFVDQMDSLARWTWGMLELSHGLDMRFGENSLTDFNLLSLVNRASEGGIPIRVVQVTQNLERRLGADFEFWLQLETGGYLAYCIQAKKVYQDKGRLTYPRLSEREGPGGPFQYETLLAHAASVGSIAMHVFYNGWGSGSDGSHQWRPDTSLYGCAAVPTAAVQWVHSGLGRKKDIKAVSYAFDSLPWSSLFRMPPSTSARSGNAATAPGRWEPKPAISPTWHDATALRNWLGARGQDTEVPDLPSQLPSYVQDALSHPTDLPDKPELPRFVVLLASTV